MSGVMWTPGPAAVEQEPALVPAPFNPGQTPFPAPLHLGQLPIDAAGEASAPTVSRQPPEITDGSGTVMASPETKVTLAGFCLKGLSNAMKAAEKSVRNAKHRSK